jgi:S1-C subfamily serine protease
VIVGESVVAIGNAYGNGGTPAAVLGTITALDQSISATDGQATENLSGMLQTNADVVEGDSGGPLLNAAGKIIGIDTAGASKPATINGQPLTQGYAIPINTALQAASLIEDGKSGGNTTIGGGPYLGVDVTSGTLDDGAFIQGVVPNTPAATLGLVAGDVITSIDGKTITDANGVSSALSDLRSGEVVQIGWTDVSGKQHTASLTLGSGPPR